MNDNNPEKIIFNSKSTDILFVGCSKTGKSSLMSGLFSEGFKTSSVIFNVEQLNKPLESYRTYYNLIESVVSETMIPRCDKDFNAIPVLVDMHSEGLRDKFATFFEIKGDFWEKKGSDISNINKELKNLMGDYYVSQNRKILFFVIDYEKAFGDSATMQRSILDNVVLSLCNDGEKNKDGRYTKNCTMSSVEAIFVVVTKSDLMGTDNRSARKKVAEDLLESEYRSFLNSLAEMCSLFKINKDNDYKPIVETFSIGHVVDGKFKYDQQDSQRLLAAVENCCITNSPRDIKNYNKKLQKEEEIRKYNDARVNKLMVENESLGKQLSNLKMNVNNVVNEKCSNIIAEKNKLRDDYVKLSKKRLKTDIWVLLLVIAILTVFAILIYNHIEVRNGKLRDELKCAKNKIELQYETIADRDLKIDTLNKEEEDLNNRIERLESDLSSARSQKNRLESQIKDLNSQIGDLKSANNKIKQKVPIIITNVEIANINKDGEIDIDYGRTIYSSSTMFLKPRISYIPVDSGKNIDLYVKLYKPDNSLSVGDESPSGYSYKYSTYISSSGSTTITGWGGEKRGHWGSGKYRIEIWYDGRILYSKTFTIISI